MKTMSCIELGGACDKLFSAESYSEISSLSQNHGREMFEAGDEEHLKAMAIMSELMKEPINMQIWLDNKEKEFDALPEN